MNENKGCTTGASFIFGLLCFVCAFFSKQGAESAKPATIQVYRGGKQVSSGAIGGNSEAVEFYEVLFYAFVIGGIILVLLGIVLACASSSENSSATISSNSSMFIKCPNCGEENGTNNEYCYKCKTFLNQKHTSPEFSNSWICPKCRKINQNYVGTCGCGKGKPK